jgi:hypothetical protein
VVNVEVMGGRQDADGTGARLSRRAGASVAILTQLIISALQADLVNFLRRTKCLVSLGS